ncbi:flagellar export chaperone FliS [Amphritea sp. 1_MG-2023]|uniref:flagellar export chaperone FliS n=1 Tax=Amphritea sp. 1_MG-2023 TaxID=3062670 RepID=UPI0026E41799|nr:flagellar export chaperone FliS [Amphritea sp. 1_MG-2023]MDO6564696.1 flagellar export chaperone FliS [Amphritea sp. 1_MG-2023]
MNVNLNALKQYKNVGLSAAVQTASPQQLITMLFDGALTALAQAKGSIERSDIQSRSTQLNKANDIILGLKDFLDLEKGGEIAANLDALYDYMVRTTSQANRDNDADKVQEVMNLLLEVKSGWTQMDVPASSD